MDFRDTSEQADFRREVRDWLAVHAPAHEVPGSRSLSRLATADDLQRAKEWQRTKADAGFAGMHWPKEYGGRGLSRLHAIIYDHEESRYNLPAGFFGIGLNFCAPTMMAYASREQNQRHLPRLLRGDDLWCQLFSEPGAGSDLAGLRTRAERDGDEWRINGQKIWTTFAHLADYAILVTRHDTTLAKHKGLTFFFLDMRSEGVEARTIKQISGTSNFNEVFLTNVRIPDSQRLGDVGDGWQVAITTLMHERAGAASNEQPPSFEHGFALAREIELEGGPALADPRVRQRLAEWYVETQALQLINWRTLTALARGAPPGPQASIRKVVAANKQQAISSFFLDLQGPGGALTDRSLACHNGLFQEGFLHCPGSRIAGGTDEILRNIIAERVLGLPGDIRRDRDIAFSAIPTGRR